jgi:Lipid A 3-O-deacylase (PagL)
MKRTGWLFQAAIAGCILLGGVRGMVAQESSQLTQSPPDSERTATFGNEAGNDQQSSQPSGPSQPEKRKRIPMFGKADEFAIATELQYYEPAPGFNRQDRDIDLQVARVALSAHFRQGWEFQFDAIALRARGTAVLSSSPPIPPPIPSNALALGVGPLARWNFLQLSRYRFFVDGEGDLILADRPFPPHGTVYDFFLRAGGGISFRVSNSYWLEAAYRFAHISNGQGVESANPTWNGRGLSIGLRRTFRPYSATLERPAPPISGETLEKAWITSVENYWATPGTHLQNPNIEHQIRALRISRAWPLPKGFEFQLGGLAADPPHVTQGNEIAGFGPLMRWNFLQTGHYRLFADGGADILQTGSPAYVIPIGGVGYNFLLRAGSGASFRLNSAYWLDASYRWGHITTGFGPGGGNYVPWSGQGLSLALRHSLR